MSALSLDEFLNHHSGEREAEYRSAYREPVYYQIICWVKQVRYEKEDSRHPKSFMIEFSDLRQGWLPASHCTAMLGDTQATAPDWLIDKNGWRKYVIN